MRDFTSAVSFPPAHLDRYVDSYLLQMSLHEKPTTVYLQNELRAKAEDEARMNNYRYLSPFLAALVDQMLNFRFLSAENLEFIRNICRELGQPWDVILVLNRIVAHARQEVRAGRLVLSGFFFHQRNGKKPEAR